jgi:hypothetical protein
MLPKIKSARWSYVEQDGSEVPANRARLMQGGWPRLFVVFDDDRETKIDPEQHLLVYAPPGVYIGLDDFQDEVYHGAHPDNGNEVMMQGATSDPRIVCLVTDFLTALRENKFEIKDVDVTPSKPVKP